MSNDAQINFVRQQGFRDAGASECKGGFPALMFQPRLIGVVVAIGIVFQSGYLFLALSAVLWWNALVPSRNPFDASYNALVARPRGLPPLTPAPAPRRFAQGMAGTFALGIGVSLLSGLQVLAWILEGFLVIALAALVFGRFCIGSYLFHVFSGHRAFANRTLPWSGGGGAHGSN
jgi:hypothetical protein